MLSIIDSFQYIDSIYNLAQAFPCLLPIVITKLVDKNYASQYT
jgi:hypothetical protein